MATTPPHPPPRDTGRTRAAQEIVAQAPTISPAPRESGLECRNGNHEYIEESKGTSIHTALSTLFHSEKFSDMIIVCGDRQFKTHRAVVCTQSPFFDKAMSGDYKVGFQRSYNSSWTVRLISV